MQGTGYGSSRANEGNIHVVLIIHMDIVTSIGVFLYFEHNSMHGNVEGLTVTMPVSSHGHVLRHKNVTDGHQTIRASLP